MASETRYVTAVPTNDGRFTLCDTPGFGDTAGAAVDIANSIGIYNAVCRARSVRPVILFSEQSFGYFRNIVRTSSRTNKYIPTRTTCSVCVCVFVCACGGGSGGGYNIVRSNVCVCVCGGGSGAHTHTRDRGEGLVAVAATVGSFIKLDVVHSQQQQGQ